MIKLILWLIHICALVWFTCANQITAPGIDLYKYNTNNLTFATSKEDVVYNLIYRLIGEQKSMFLLTINSSLTASPSGLDSFKIIKTNATNKVRIYATNGVTAAWGFHYYLKEYCNCHISWDGDQISLPSVLPNVNITITANDKYRYYQNVVTTSYSFVWWNWTCWEREIDWMALNGINLALAFNGQEEIWRRVYLKIGLNNSEIDQYFTGPAFLAWNRMGNIRGWGGPLTDAWHNSSVALQKRILQRMRALGIVPVLPAFAGHVPRAFKRIHPEANISETHWNNFQSDYCCIYYLSPTDKMFTELGSLFLKEYIKEFGTDHIYNCDSFNEIIPSSGDLNFIRSAGQSIFKSITDVDPVAVWMMQGWMFISEFYFWTKDRAKALLTSVPQGKVIVLDLYAELLPQYKKLDNFFGQPFIWCTLHNFGGTLGMHGNLKSINENIFLARSYKNSSLIGTGITPEGINQNYIVYDLMTEMAWRKKPVNLTVWVSNYAKRRYKYASNNASLAWYLLKDTVYSDSEGIAKHGDYIFVMKPSLDLHEKVWYNKRDVWKAFNYLLESSKEMSNLSKPFLYDLVDITRQSLQLLLDSVYLEMVTTFKSQDIVQFRKYGAEFLKILTDLDKILGTNDKFLLGKWLNDAKSLGTNSLEKHLYEQNARNQITLWGPNGEIRDYANKQWSGLVMDYYKKRWQIFITSAILSLQNKTPLNETNLSHQIFINVEKPFTYDIKDYPDYPMGDPVIIAGRIQAKWFPN